MHLLLQANSLKIPLADKSVHMCVTSPPYWGLRDYGTARWDGGDAECDHAPKITPRIERPRSGLTGSLEYCDAKDPFYRDLCGKCGARRIDNQLGLEPTPDEFIRNMVMVFREVRRVLKDDGTCWVNMGDSYVSTSGLGQGRNRDGGDGFAPARAQYGLLHGMKLGKEYKPKDLCGIPWRLAFALQSGGADWKACQRLYAAMGEVYDAFGDDPIPGRVQNMLDRWRAEYADAKGDSWYLRSDIIWAKPNPMPESVTDRPTKSHEYLFLLSKQERYYFDADAVREDYLSNQRGDLPARPEKAIGPQNRNGHSQWETGLKDDRSHSGRNIRTVWSIPTEAYPGAHFATFPRKLVEPCIKAGTSEKGCCPACGTGWVRVVQEGAPIVSGNARGKNAAYCEKRAVNGDALFFKPRSTTGWRPDCECRKTFGDEAPVPAVVLDPFAGSGTTLVVANALGRHGIGLDLSREYLGLAHRRINRPHAPVPRPSKEESHPLFGEGA